MPRALRCTDVRRRIDDHVDGLLPAQEAESVRDHLDSCTECRETAFAAKAASTSLAVWGDLEPPTGCFDRILTRIDTLPAHACERSARHGTAARRAWLRIVRVSLPVAAAASLLGVFLFTGPDTRARVPHLSTTQIGGPLTPASMRFAPAPPAAPSRDDVLLLHEMEDGVLRSGRTPRGRLPEIWTPR